MFRVVLAVAGAFHISWFHWVSEKMLSN